MMSLSNLPFLLYNLKIMSDQLIFPIQQFRMKAISNPGKCKCKQHEFILKPLTKDLHFSRKVSVSLCECHKIKQKKKILKIHQNSTKVYPVFNRDRNYAAPAFILPSEKEHFEQNRQIYLKDHKRKLKQYEEISENLELPAPRSNYDYCNVCCCSYENYIEHIASQAHHKNIKRAKFNNYILQIEEIFNHEKQNSGSLKRSATSRCIQIEEDSSVGIFGYKKVKTDSRTELPSQNNIGFLMRENFIKEYQTYCQLNNYLIMQQQQKNIMENSFEHYSFNPYNINYNIVQKVPSQYNNFFYAPQNLISAQEMMSYQNFMILERNCWQNSILMTPQNNVNIQYPYILNALNSQPFYYMPSYFQSISAIQ